MHLNKMEEEHTEHNRNSYVDLVLESHDANTHHATCHIEHTKSQKKRRRFIPFKYHSKIFKASKKKRHVDDHQISTKSSSYASCRTFSRDSGRSNVSSNTYQEIGFLHHTEPARCNSIASKAPVFREADQAMEIPKKKNRHAKKYIGIFFIILVCATISAVIANIFSTKSLGENFSSTVSQKLSKAESHQQTLSNVSMEEVKNYVDGLRSDLEELSNMTKGNMEQLMQVLPNKKDLEELSNMTKGNMEQLMQVLPNKKDMLSVFLLNVRKYMEELSNEKEENLQFLLQSLPNSTAFYISMKKDLEELSKKSKKNMELIETLSNRTEFDGLKDEIMGIPYRIVNTIKCKDKCLGDMYGNYQYCYNCEKFVTCFNNGTKKIMDCAPAHPNRKVYWDDFEKRCIFKSRTCHPSYTFPEKETQ